MSLRVRPCAGFSLLELMVVVAILSGVLLLFSQVFARASGLHAASRASLMAKDEERKSLDYLANILRGAAYPTLGGFALVTDAKDPLYGRSRATSVTFQCAIGADASGPAYDVAETLSWRASTKPVNGIAQPGEIVLTKGTSTVVVAPRVPAGGFSVVLSEPENTLRIYLTTYSSTSQGVATTTTAEHLVYLRN